jgi:hypothetical protein
MGHHGFESQKNVDCLSCGQPFDVHNLTVVAYPQQYMTVLRVQWFPVSEWVGYYGSCYIK